MKHSIIVRIIGKMLIKTCGLILFFSSSQSESLFRPNLPLIDYNFASWGSTGGWVPNAYILNIKKACSNVKHLGGNAWLNFLEGFNVRNDKCPIPAINFNFASWGSTGGWVPNAYILNTKNACSNTKHLSGAWINFIEGFNIPTDKICPIPVGEYRIVIDKVYSCETTKNHPIQFNWYLSKKTSSITELKGNVTLLIPFDDNLTIDFNFASWGSTGGWVPNAFILNTKKACSNTKHLGGNAWINFIKGFNIPADKCPIPVGTYITSGIDKKKLEDMNYPKVCFYGKYKTVLRYKNLKNEVVSCFVIEFDLMRPWETPI